MGRRALSRRLPKDRLIRAEQVSSTRTSRPLMEVMVLALRCAWVRSVRAATERTEDCIIMVAENGWRCWRLTAKDGSRRHSGGGGV